MTNGTPAGPDLHSRAGRLQQDRHRGHAGLQRGERLRIRQLGLAISPCSSLRPAPRDIALAIGAEKMNIPDKAKAFAIFDARLGRVAAPSENFESLVRMGEGVVPPPGSESDRPYSKFMSIYAAMCRHHMKTYGTTQRQIAAVCAKNHQHSVHNPLSQFRQPFTVDEVLAAAADHLSADAADVRAIVGRRRGGRSSAREAGLKRIGRRSIALRSGSPPASCAASRTGTRRSAAQHLAAWLRLRPTSRRASVPRTSTSPRSMTPPRWARSCSRRTSGSCRWARAAPRPSGETSRWAACCRSIPPAAWNPRDTRSARRASASFMNWSTQLRGEAGARQVDRCPLAMQENGGGMQGVEEAAVAIHILTPVAEREPAR